MDYYPFGQQEDFHLSQARYRGAFAGKRCLNPQSRVLTTDGVKCFGDISGRDLVLSFDQKANRFRFSQSGSAFPKTKETGYRVIHDQGEFVASAHHRILLSDGVYRSVQEIYDSFHQGSDGQGVSFLSPSHSIWELDRLWSLSGARHWKRTHANWKDRCETCSRRCDPQLHLKSGFSLEQSQQIHGAQEHERFAFSHEPFLLRGDQEHKRSECNHLYPSSVQSAIQGEVGPWASLSFHGPGLQRDGRIYGQTPRLYQEVLRQHPCSCELNKEARSDQLDLGLNDVLTCESRILAIEVVSSQWFWDIEVPGDNNYLSEGAIHHNSGKTESGAVECVIHTESQIGWKKGGVDPYLGVIIAPTSDMLRRLSMAKFLAYAKPFEFTHHQTFQEIEWHNGSKVLGISGDKPKRLEGVKANWIWIDEVFQVSEQLFLESIARVSDQQGRIWCTGSLGVQYNNPKQHWAYKYFKQNPLPNSECFEWATVDNPYFPKEELSLLKDTLDPRTFRQMFTIDWNTPGTNLVYDEWSDLNQIKNFQLKPSHEVSCVIDWGWAHQMACLFFAYDRLTDTVTLFDEIVGSKITLEQLHARIQAKGYPVKRWFCDIAGNQEREQTGRSNVQWFKDKGIRFEYRRTAVTYGIPIVRSYIFNGAGQRKFFIDEVRCPKSLDGILNYRYPEKDGMIIDENPVKKDDDCADAIRYYFVNRLDKKLATETMTEFNRWGEWDFHKKK